MPKHPDICPASYAWGLLIPLRRLIQNPDRILRGLVLKGQTVLDVGCGPGFFTLTMARMVGNEGRVIGADLQPEMLSMLERNARKAGLDPRITQQLCTPDKIGLGEPIDFALAFYMVHEVPNAEALLREVYDHLKPDGRLLLVEPKLHVSAARFGRTADICRSIGFQAVSEPRIALSRSTLFVRPG